MVKAISVAFLLAVVAGCTSLPPAQYTASACSGGQEASYACQVERYHNVDH